jgi:hypothetical protein
MIYIWNLSLVLQQTTEQLCVWFVDRCLQFSTKVLPLSTKECNSRFSMSLAKDMEESNNIHETK